jgi:uncharacterized protein YegL
MQGERIQALNNGLQTFKNALVADPVAALRVEVAIASFDSVVRVVQDFVTADAYEPPALTARGQTCMGTGILKALDLVQARKAHLRAYAIQYYRPWVFMVTDGKPEGESPSLIEEAARRIREDEANKRVAFFVVGVENADMERLRQISVREPVKLAGLKFEDMFLWLSTSMTKVAQAKIGEQVALPQPSGWAVVSQ